MSLLFGPSEKRTELSTLFLQLGPQFQLIIGCRLHLSASYIVAHQASMHRSFPHFLVGRCRPGPVACECSLSFGATPPRCSCSFPLSSSFWRLCQHIAAAIISILGSTCRINFHLLLFTSLLSVVMPVLSRSSFVLTLLKEPTTNSLLGPCHFIFHPCTRLRRFFCGTRQWCDHLPCSSSMCRIPTANSGITRVL